MKESTREVCGSASAAGKNPKGAWRNDEVKAELRGKDEARKEVLGATYEEAKE